MAATNALLGILRQQLIDSVYRAQYRLNGTWYNAAVNEKKIDANGLVSVGFYMSPQSGGTITQCRLVNQAGAVLVTKDESIAVSADASAVYYFFTFNIYELT